MSLETLDLAGDPDRPAIVLLHEGLGSVALWREFPRTLSAATGNRVFAYSRHGHGASPPPPKPRTPRFMHEEAEDVLPQILTEHGIEQPILLGHSDGASIALIHAARHPITALIAIAPHVFVEDKALEAIARARDAYQDGGLKQRMARHHADPDAAFYGWNGVWLDPAFADWDLRPLIAQIAAPILLIQGIHDQYGTLAQLDEIERNATAPVTRVHLSAQHAPHLEAPDDALGAIARFTKRLSAGSAPPPAGRTRQ